VRIVVLTQNDRGGGAEFVARTWADGLAKRGHEVSFVATAAPAAEPVDGVVYLRRSPSPRPPVLELRDHLNSWRPDVVLSLLTYPNLVALLAARLASPRPPVVISERNVPSVLLRQQGRSQRLQLRLARRIYRFASAVVAISHPVAADLVSGFAVDPARCTVVPNPAIAKVEGRQRERETSERLHLVLPCRLVEQKDPLLIVEVAKILSRRGRDVELTIFGVGPLEAEVRRETSSAGIPTHMAGWQEEWFLKCPPGAVVCLPSHVEGFGNVLVEAAAVNVPVVTMSSALGVADAVIPGVTGHLATTRDPEEFADLVDEASRLPTWNVDGWLRRFSPEESTAKVERVLRQQVDRD
jgi:glycosyltransferase involved in cell wall biosynthesis